MTVGVVTILISAWGAVIPFVEPIFGFHATGTPSFHWNAAHALLAVVPGVIGVAMGFVVLWAASQVAVGRGRVALVWAGLITILSGAWFIIGPTAWPVITRHGVYFAPASPLRGLLYQVGYALGTGVILIVCGGYVVGWASRQQISESAAVGSDSGIGTNGGSPGTSRAQNSVGTSVSVCGLSPSRSRFARTYGAAALAAQGMMRPSDPRVLELLPGEFDLGSVNSVEDGYCR